MILCVCPNPSIDSFAWLESIDPGKTNRISALKKYPGGKGTHVALAVNELDVKVKLMGIWAGKSGEYIRIECEKFGIKTSGIEIEGENRHCYTFKSNSNEFNSTELLEPGPSLSNQSWKNFLKKFEVEIKQASLICISGSFPTNAPEDAYFRMIEICKTNNKKVIIDCSGIQLKNALKSSFFGIHLNEHEIQELDPENTIDNNIKLLKDHCEMVAISLGEKGLKLYYDELIIQANVTVDQVLSTVGSGDCLTAGIAVGFYKKQDLVEIARLGVSAGAANCINEDLGMLKKSDVVHLLQQTEFKNKSNV